MERFNMLEELQDGTSLYKMTLRSFGAEDQVSVFVPKEGEPKIHLLDFWDEHTGEEIRDESIEEQVLRDAVEVYGGKDRDKSIREGLVDIVEAFGYDELVESIAIWEKDEESLDPNSLEALRQAGYELPTNCHSLEDAERGIHPKNNTKMFEDDDGGLWAWDRMHNDHYDVLMSDNAYIRISPEGEVLGEPKDSTIDYSEAA